MKWLTSAVKHWKSPVFIKPNSRFIQSFSYLLSLSWSSWSSPRLWLHWDWWCWKPHQRNLHVLEKTWVSPEKMSFVNCCWSKYRQCLDCWRVRTTLNTLCKVIALCMRERLCFTINARGCNVSMILLNSALYMWHQHYVPYYKRCNPIFKLRHNYRNAIWIVKQIGNKITKCTTC